MKKFEGALQMFAHREYVTVELRCLQLDANAIADPSTSVLEVLHQKQNVTEEKIKELVASLSSLGSEVGVQFQWEEMRYINSFDAHRLVKYAKQEQKDIALAQLLFQRYFKEQKNISEADVLVNIARELNLNEAEVDELLCFNHFARAVKEDMLLAEEMGIEGVPFFIFNEKYGIAGPQSEDSFLQVLEQLWEEDKGAIIKRKETTSVCKPNYCVGDECK